MRPKYKITGCARFFVFLVIFVPAVFFGAAYFRGENGVQIIKDFFNGITGGSNDKAEEKEKSKETYDVDDLKEELRKAEEENKRLKEEIEAKDKEIEKLKTGK